MSWHPETYARFLGPRTRPALDLVNAVPLATVHYAADLGCGPGNSTAVLRARWPNAALTGIDSSPEMLAAAAREGPAGVRWEQADLRSYRPESPLDLLFSNATLQWVDEHETLFPRLLEAVRPGGVLAVQMPRNFEAPSHVALRELAAEPPWRDALNGVLRLEPVASPAAYLGWLAGATTLDVWETEYHHVLEGEDPVLSWVSGTALVPVRAALGDHAFPPFRAALGERLRVAYPARHDGRTVFPFRRIFVVATR